VITPVTASPRRLVPPQASACGLDAGKSVCGCPSVCASLLPLSPAAAVTVLPSAAASAMASSSAVRPCAVHASSDCPQLMLIAVGVGLACTALVTASTKPWSVLGAKYTTWAAPGATAPATSMSSRTSPSAPFGFWPGVLAAPSTPTAVTSGTGRPSPPK
jgi:hypothetical protein